jgi:hypothetical protein
LRIMLTIFMEVGVLSSCLCKGAQCNSMRKVG